MGTPPISKITRPIGTLGAYLKTESEQRWFLLTELPRTQRSLYLYPYEFRFPVDRYYFIQQNNKRHTFMQTGMSGKTLKYTLAPLKTFSFLIITSWAVDNCFALSLAPFPTILIPHSPWASVVPFVDPPIGIGIRPLWRFAYLTCFGASWLRARVNMVSRGKETDRVRWTEGRKILVREQRENMWDYVIGVTA